MNIQSTVKLNNSVEMPWLGLGTFLSPAGDETQNAVCWALEAGYRHIDTARAYNNERDVGLAVQQSGIPRQEVFVTTKIWNDDQGYDSTLQACDDSLKRLGVDYIDLYLIHWPVSKLRNDTYRALVKLLEDGKARSIGVSNFTVRHLEELLGQTDVIPAVNQIEFSPFHQRKELVSYCQSKGIIVEAYSTLSRGRRMEDERLVAIGKKYGKTPAQVALRWALQNRAIIIPKSVHRERIIENANIFDFEISVEDMQSMATFDEQYSVLPSGWNPDSNRWA